MKPVWILAPLAVLFVAWVSCTTVKHIEVESASQEVSKAPDHLPARQIVGYTTSDAVYHPFEGYARFSQPDSIQFLTILPPQWKHSSEKIGYSLTLARADVSSLGVQKTKTLATIGLVVLVTTVIVGVFVAANSNNDPAPTPAASESCPFVYSWDGHQFVLDGEPYGGATIKALERTDVTELEHLAPSNGQYRLLLTNEMPETQHTNRVDLMVVDHGPGLVVAPDLDGVLHAFRAVHPLIEAHDESGRNLLPWLVEKDHATWHPDLEAASRHLPLADTRDHITLTFDRPPGVRAAYLLADVATSPWGAGMLRPMLEMRGATLGLFYAAINADAGSRRKLLEWNEREELFYLGVEVEEDGHWVRQGHLIGGGPVVAETRTIPLDLSRVTGSQVRVRVHPPVGFWMFNAFRLAEAEAPVRVRVIEAMSARDVAGKDVLASLTGDDGSYLTFGTNDDLGLVRFPVPAQEAGTARTVFARTRGWYEIHTPRLGFPDFAEVDRVTNEPGYPVQLALRRFRERSDSWLAAWAGRGQGDRRMAERN